LLPGTPIGLPEYPAGYSKCRKENCAHGYLPYSIVDGWRQIRQDFAHWRADVNCAETATSPAERTWFEADRRLREGRILRDIGIWSRYVGDASQPMLVTVHHDGWGNYPNPNGYTMANIHARVGSSFVRHNLETLNGGGRSRTLQGLQMQYRGADQGSAAR
jgi:hypothetical protein